MSGAIEVVTSLECDECGRSVAKIWRNHHGHRYCSTCYCREFKRSSCPKCGNFAKLLKRDPNAVCRACERDRPCARCKKSGFNIALMTPYGPVCGSCAPYFRDKKACEICGIPSGRLTRVSRLWHEKKVCQKCAREDHATCHNCSRHRLLSRALDGRLLCKACLIQGEKACQTCGSSMPAGYGRRCEACYWQEMYGRRCTQNQAAFASEEMRQIFNSYTKWLAGICGTKKAAVVLNRHMPFFLEIDERWGDIPSFPELLAYFGAATLRKNFLPFRWLSEEGLVELDEQLKKEDAEWRRIRMMLNKFGPKTKERIYIDSYHKVLQQKFNSGLTSPSSIRLALSPAIALLSHTSSKQIYPLSQGMLDDYLSKSPGQRAALSGFICHIRDSFNLKLELPQPNRQASLSIKKRKLENQMLELMSCISDVPNFREAWVMTCLAYFHDVPKKISAQFLSVVIETKEGFTVQIDGRTLWMPLPSNDVNRSNRQIEPQ